jgi:hypothetical protein
MPVEPQDNPLSKGMEISGNLTGSSSKQVVDLLYEAQESLLMLQASAVARINLGANGQDLLLLPVHTGCGSGVNDSDATASAALLVGGTQLHHVKLMPASHVLSCGQMQQMSSLVQQQAALSPRDGLAGAISSVCQQQRFKSQDQQAAAAIAAATAAAAAVLAQDSSAFSQGGQAGVSAAAAAAVTAAAAAMARASPPGSAHGGSSASADNQLGYSHQLPSQLNNRSSSSNRKADYVIVTEVIRIFSAL